MDNTQQPLDQAQGQQITNPQPVQPVQQPFGSAQGVTPMQTVDPSQMAQPLAQDPMQMQTPITQPQDNSMIQTGQPFDSAQGVAPVQAVQPFPQVDQQVQSYQTDQQMPAYDQSMQQPVAPAPVNSQQPTAQDPYEAPYTQEEINEEILDALDRIEAKLEDLEQKL